MGKIIDNYSLQVQLGSGIYSTVYKAINIKTNQVVAIKMIKTDKFRELPKLQQGAINEINILTKLQSCPHIIKYYDMLKTTNNFYFVYQFCNGGTLEQKLRERNYFPQKEALQYFRQIIEAFKLLTKYNIMHRDLKPQNILMHNNMIKIADFGFCKILDHQDQMSQTMLGSPIYMAPQILKGQHYTIKADIWSLGVVLFKMLYGFCPYQSSNIAKLILLVETTQFTIPSDPSISSTVIKLIKRMLTKDPQKRADWNEVFSYQINKSGIMTSKQSSILSSTSNSIQTNASLSPSYNNKTFTNVTSQKNISPTKQFMFEQKSNNSQFQLKVETSYKDGNLQRSQTDNSNMSKSPYRSKTFTNRIDNYIKNHSKHIELVGLCMQISAYGIKVGLQLAYYILKGIQYEYSNMIETINREKKNNDYEDLLIILSDESKQLEIRLKYYEEQIETSYNKIKNQKKLKLKLFVKSMKLQTSQQLVLASRLIDFIEENLLIRKETYEKLSKDQLSRQIKSKFQ